MSAFFCRFWIYAKCGLDAFKPLSGLPCALFSAESETLDVIMMVCFDVQRIPKDDIQNLLEASMEELPNLAMESLAYVAC